MNTAIQVSEHWQRHGPALERYRQALAGVQTTLASDAADTARLRAILEHEPDPGDEVPATDAARVDLVALEQRLEEFWAAYYQLPLPPGCESARQLYRDLPLPLPTQHRSLLEQCLRVVIARFGWGGAIESRRLQGLVLGFTHPLPGMEELHPHHVARALAAQEAARGRR